jgi:hypothetical protein
MPLPTVINDTGGVQLFGVIAGLTAYPTDLLGTIDIQNYFAILSQTSLGLQISSFSTTPTFVWQMAYVVIFYNKGYFDSSSYSNIYNNLIQLSDSSKSSYTNSQLEMADFNTFIGLTSFSISNQNTFEFFTTVQAPNSFTTSSSLFNSFTVSFLVMYINYCDYQYPYLYTNNLCYANCPDSASPNLTSLECVPCT